MLHQFNSHHLFRPYPFVSIVLNTYLMTHHRQGKGVGNFIFCSPEYLKSYIDSQDVWYWSYTLISRRTSVYKYVFLIFVRYNIVPYFIELNGAPALMKCRWNVEQCASLYYLLQYSQYLVFLVFLNLSLSPTSLSLSFFSLSRSHSLTLSVLFPLSLTFSHSPFLSVILQWNCSDF